VCVHVGVRGNADEDALLTELFNTRAYNQLSRPVSNLSESIQVQLGLVLQKIVQVVCESCNYIKSTQLLLLCRNITACTYKRFTVIFNLLRE